MPQLPTRYTSGNDPWRMPEKKYITPMYCYQCDKEVQWLASDGRCKDCTRLTPEEVRGE